MAIEFAEGFDPVAQNSLNLNAIPEYGWNATLSNFDISTTEQRNGLACARYSGSSGAGGNCTYGLPVTTSKTIRYAHKRILSNAGLPGMGFIATSGNTIVVNYEAASNAFVLWIANVAVFTTPTNYPSGVYYHIELAYNAATGAYQLWIDETLVTSGVGAITGTTLDTLFWGKGSGGGSTNGEAYWDDISVSDDIEILGDCVVDYDFPDADTANADWILASGVDGFAMVNSTPPDPLKYIETSTINAISDFDVPDPVPIIYQVHSVMVVSNGLRSGASVEEYETRLTHNSVTDSSPAHVAPQTTAGWTRDLFPTNPDTGLAWTPTNVLGLSVGVEKVT